MAKTIIDLEISKLRKKIGRISKTIYMLHKLAFSAIESKDNEVAIKVINNFDDIKQLFDNLMMDATVLLTKNPFTVQLRQVISLLSITKDLKNISKLAIDIAKYQLRLSKLNDNITSGFLKKTHFNFNKVLKKIFAFLIEKKPYEEIHNLQSNLKRLKASNLKTLEEMRAKILSNKNTQDNLNHLFYELELVVLIDRQKLSIKEICESLLFINEGVIIHL